VVSYAAGRASHLLSLSKDSDVPLGRRAYPISISPPLAVQALNLVSGGFSLFLEFTVTKLISFHQQKAPCEKWDNRSSKKYPG